MSNWVDKTPTADEWSEILEQHVWWLRNNNCGGRANLRGANLRRANLNNANLSSADLSSTNLSNANLSSANLNGANLSNADLNNADLNNANLSSANLRRANLSNANLNNANLSNADLNNANLNNADLNNTDLHGAKGTALAIARTRILPEGDLIGWKKCRDGVIVQLLIPQKARRSHAFGRKCRAEAAIVMATFPPDTKAESLYAKGFYYVKGETVRPDKWDDDWTKECGDGIHFYLQRIEAENHP